MLLLYSVVAFLSGFRSIYASLEQGIFEKQISFAADSAEILAFQRSALKGTSIEVKFKCDEGSQFDVEIAVRSSPCYQEFYQVLGNAANSSENLQFYFSESSYVVQGFDYNLFWYFKSKKIAVTCNGHYVHVPDLSEKHLQRVLNAKVWSTTNRKKRETSSKFNSTTSSNDIGDNSQSALKTYHPAFILEEDGMYIIIVKIVGKFKQKVNNIGVYIEWKHSRGYLSPIDWPLLPFYGVFCALYAVYGLVWLILCFMQWRDLLRIQFWIGR